MSVILQYHQETEAGYNIGYQHAKEGQAKQSQYALMIAGYMKRSPEARAFIRGYNRAWRDVAQSKGLSS